MENYNNNQQKPKLELIKGKLAEMSQDVKPEDFLNLVIDLKNSLYQDLYPLLISQVCMMMETLTEIQKHEAVISQLINDAIKTLAAERATKQETPGQEQQSNHTTPI